METSDVLSVASDYTLNLVIKKGSQTVFNMPPITVNGLSASWSDSEIGQGSVEIDGWFELPGTAQYDVNQYLERDKFYDDAGCYTFELEVVNQFYAGDTSTYTSSNSWELDWDEQDSTQDGAMTTC